MTTRPPLRLGTRASALATTQSGLVAELVEAHLGREVELVEVSTEGDRSAAPLAQMGGTGVFVSALRDALLDGHVDFAVHSLKDLPTTPADGIALAAVPVREDPRDVSSPATASRSASCPSAAGSAPARRVGSASSRPSASAWSSRASAATSTPGSARSASGEVDAIVLARAGLARLGRLDEVTEVLDPLQMLPAPGQGALAIECRSGDTELVAALARLDDPATRAAVTAERAVLSTLEAGCSAPLGALAEVVEGEDGEELWLRAVVLSEDGGLSVRMSTTGPVAEAARIGTRLASDMLDEGAADLMEAPPVRNQHA